MIKQLKVINKEQQELLGEAYKNYVNNRPSQFYGPYYTQEEFINECKTDTEFSEKWGLKIEERELTYEERQNLYFKLNPEFRLVHEDMDKHMDKHNVPAKLITITYNDKTIESYE
jgi:hypothetical protein